MSYEITVLRRTAGVLAGMEDDGAIGSKSMAKLVFPYLSVSEVVEVASRAANSGEVFVDGQSES